MIDLEAHFGRSGRMVSYDDLMEVMRKDKVVVEPGDFVLFRTGFAEMLLEMGKQPDRETLFSTSCALDGRDARLQQWVTDSGAVALISDHFAVEAMPASPCMDDFCATLPLHAHCLFRLGCYLGEMFYLTALGRLAACERAQPLSVHRPAAAAAWRGWFTSHAGGDRLTVWGSPATRSQCQRALKCSYDQHRLQALLDVPDVRLIKPISSIAFGNGGRVTHAEQLSKDFDLFARIGGNHHGTEYQARILREIPAVSGVFDAAGETAGCATGQIGKRQSG